MDKPPKARRNLTRPRFFERATPNQMWQSDLFTFRLGGKYAYVVAFMDDCTAGLTGTCRTSQVQFRLKFFKTAVVT